MDPKKMLIAVDASENAQRAAEYAARIVGATPGFSLTLLTLERPPERDLYKDDAAHRAACQAREGEMRAAQGAIKAVLVAGGVPAGMISAHYVASCKSPQAEGADQCSLGQSIALEILDFAKAQGCGTVVVGRRGVSKAEEFLFGSVSSKIVHNAKNCTVWVIS
ncbi:MAG: universal stress protein [Desulfovibrionaceae bacterium]|nr:universal stress protein [Desulfovibrionaceae bacterium]